MVSKVIIENEKGETVEMYTAEKVDKLVNRIKGEDGIGGIVKFEVVNGELIMYYSTEQTPEIYIVSKDPNSDSYYGKLGVDESLVGCLVFLYKKK